MTSPYAGVPVQEWQEITKKLVADHPLDMDELVAVVVDCWKSIFDSRFGRKGFQIGKQIFPKPQIMGFLLHELIPLELAGRYPTEWRGEQSGSDKDIVYIPADKFSIEVKTSSNGSQVYGNRSYAQATSNGKKAKSGYYLTVNFEACTKAKPAPELSQIKFGWLDSSDWIGQKAETGQQSRLPPEVRTSKFITLYRKT